MPSQKVLGWFQKGSYHLSNLIRLKLISYKITIESKKLIIRQEQVQRQTQKTQTKLSITSQSSQPNKPHINKINTQIMQLQQLRNQNGLLQQLVQTLERQIQSKNQQQTIMIQELEHLIKDNDNLSHKYNALLGESRKWNEKEKYYERLVKEVEETLMRTRVELGECKRRLEVNSQHVVSVGSEVGVANSTMGNSHSSPQIQVANQASNTPNTGMIINRPNQQSQTSSHLIISVPKIYIPNTLQHLNLNNNSNLSNTPLVVQEQSFIPQQGYKPQSSPRQQDQSDLIAKLQAQIKSLKSLSQSLKLQLTQKDVELKSKTQKLHQVTQELTQTQDQIQNLGAVLDQLRKQNDLAVNDLEKKDQELKMKDEQFWNMYKEMEEEWKGKNDRVEEEVAKVKGDLEEKNKELVVREEQIKALTEVINQKQVEIQAQVKAIEQLNSQLAQSKSAANLNQQAHKIEEKPAQNPLQKNQQQQIQSLKNLVQVLHQTLSDTQNRHNNEMEKLMKKVSNKEQVFRQKERSINQEKQVLKGKVDAIEAQNLQLRERLSSVGKENNQMRERISAIEAENNQLRERVNQVEGQDNELKERMNNFDGENAHLRERLNIVEGQNSKLRERNNEIEAQNAQLKEKVITIESETQKLKEKINTFVSQNNQFKHHHNTFQSQSNHLNNKITSLLSQNHQLKQKINSISNELIQIKHQDQQLTITNDKLTQQKQQRNNSLRQLAATVEITKVQLLQKDRKIEENLAQIQIKQTQINQLNSKVKQLESKLQETVKRLEQSQVQLKQSQNMFIQTQTIIQQLQQQNQSLIKQTINLKDQKQHLITQLNTIHNNNNQHPTLNNLPSYIQSLQSLQKQNNQLREQVNQFAKNFEQIGISIQEMRNSIDELEVRLEAKEKENERLVVELGELGRINKGLQEQLQVLVLAQQQQQQQQQQQLLPQQSQPKPSPKQQPHHSNSQLSLQPPSSLSLQPSPYPTPSPSNHVQLQMFYALQQQYTRLYQQLQQLKQQFQDQRTKFITIIKQKDYELINTNRKLKELTSLFTQKTIENDQLRESIDKQPSSKGEMFGSGGKCNNSNSVGVVNNNEKIVAGNIPNTVNGNLNIDKSPNNNPINKNPSPSRIIPQEQPSHRSLPRHQQTRPSLPRNTQHPSPPRQQTRPSLPHHPTKTSTKHQNLVQNNLSSPRSHQQKTPNQILLQDQINQSNDGFDIRIQPTVRKSDLPLHSPQFLQNNSESKPQRPKSNITSVDQNKRQHLEALPVEIDISYLRNSIAQFGLDIDFNAIAKHIGLEMSQQQEQEKRRQEEKQKKRLNSGRENLVVSKEDGLMDSDKGSKQRMSNELQMQLKDQYNNNDNNYDNVITLKQSLYQIPNHNNPKKPQGMYSSQGSNPSQSQKRSTPGALRVPIVDQQIMRSSYGSNNQFTQIVLYYQQELNKLRKHISELNEQMDRERVELEERLRSKDEGLVVRQDEERLVRVCEREGVLGGMRGEVQVRCLGEEEGDRQLQQQQQQLQQVQQVNPHKKRSINLQIMNPIPGNISLVQPNPPTHQITFLPLPQTSEFRTSIQPRMAANIQLPSSNAQQQTNNNPQNNTSPLMTSQQQQETVELIRELSSQLEIMQKTLAEKQDQLRQLQYKNCQLQAGNNQLNHQLQMIRKQNQNIVNQFSQLSLQQNNCITQLQQKIQELTNQLNLQKQQKYQLTQQLNQLQQQHSQLIQQLTTIQTNQHTKQQQIQLLTKQLNQKSVMFEKITIQNVEYETQLLQLNQQVQELVGKLQEIQQLHVDNTNEKEEKIKKLQKNYKDLQKNYKELQKTHKQTKDQLLRYTNENESLACEYSKFIQTTKQLDGLSKKYQDLQNHSKSVQNINKYLQNKQKTLQSNCKTLENTNKTLENQLKSIQSQNRSLQITNKTLQQRLTKLTHPHQQLRQSHQPPTHPINRISDLLQHQTCHQQNFTINNISNIHAIVDQLGDDSFILHQKDKQISILKDVVQKQRKEIEQLVEEARQREGYVSQVEEKFAGIENSFNLELMGIKKQNAQMSSELLKLKKQLFTYQKDTGDIDKFIQQNFLNSSSQKPTIPPKRFSVQNHNHHQDKFPSVQSHQIHRSQRQNNSFNFQPYNPHDTSSLSSRNKVNMTQFYYPKQKLPSSKPLNMGQLFIGHKTRPRPEHTPSDNSLTQLIKSITASNKHKSMTQVAQTSTNYRPQTNYSKYLNEYQRYEQKIRQQSKAYDVQFQMQAYGMVGHMKKRSDHGK